MGNQEALTVKPDGTVMQGNTRTKVLEERGIGVNSLPRAPFDDSIDMFLPQISTPGGGGGSLKDKKYPFRNEIDIMITRFAIVCRPGHFDLQFTYITEALE